MGILENTLVAEEGLEFVVVFSGKSYILSKVGDKLGMQPPAGGCTTAQKKSRTTKMARENTSFSEIVSVLQVTQVAGTGFELLVRFRGKTYVLTKAGDQLGIISEKARS